MLKKMQVFSLLQLYVLVVWKEQYLLQEKKIRSYSTGNQVNCIHGYRYGTDLVMRDVYEVTHRCSNCGILLVDTEYGTSYECHGYN